MARARRAWPRLLRGQAADSSPGAFPSLSTSRWPSQVKSRHTDRRIRARPASRRLGDPLGGTNLRNRDFSMHRFLRIPITGLACVVYAGLALAQTSAPAAPPPTAGQTGGRGGPGGFVPTPVVIGPPAPVPPEVAIPRPTPAELAQVNAAVKKFIDSDKSSAKPLLKKFESLMLLQPPRLNVAATFTQTAQRQGPRHEGFVEIAKQGNIDLLLHGDSITDWWVQGDANKAMFDKYFGGIRTANFAIAGDTTQGVLWGLQERRRPGLPAEGGHADDRHQQHRRQHRARDRRRRRRRRARDAQGLSEREDPAAGDLPARACPAIRCATRSPRSTGSSRGSTISSTSSTWTSARSSSTTSGVFLPDTFRPDNLHPQAKGYDIWGEAVKAKLAELMK